MPHVAAERKLVAWQMIEDGSSIADIQLAVYVAKQCIRGSTGIETF